ncbi:MAG: hypothetical protein ABIK89_20925 [Planctomycetota bacterium]
MEEERIEEEPAFEPGDVALATWDELCEPGPVRHKVIDFGPGVGKRQVEYRPFLSFEDSQRLSEVYQMGDRKKRQTMRYMVAVLKRVMVSPRIETPVHERLVLKARADVLLEILGETLGSDSDEMEALRSDLGGS